MLDKNNLKEDFNKIPKTRHREYVDRRSYIIGALYYGCGMTEREVADFLVINRDVVHYNKFNAVRLKDDPVYKNNIEELSFRYKYNLNKITLRARTRKDKITISFSEKDLNKLYKFHKKKDFSTIVSTIKYLVRNGIKSHDVWEK